MNVNPDEEVMNRAMDDLEKRGGVVRLQYRPAQTVFGQGLEAGGTYWMKRGQIKLESIDAGGKTHFLHVVSGVKVLGLGAFLLNRPHAYQARALSETNVIWLDRVLTRKFLDDHPFVLEPLMRQWGEEMELLETRLRSAYSLDALERVYETIAYLKGCDPCRKWSRIEIAEWAGTTPETVARSISELRQQGRIWTEGRKIQLLRKKLLN
jgi:CRP-like cAMP-binding protein